MTFGMFEHVPCEREGCSAPATTIARERRAGRWNGPLHIVCEQHFEDVEGIGLDIDALGLDPAYFDGMEGGGR